MATIVPTLTITSTDVHPDHALSISVTDSLTVEAPMADVSRIRTGDDPYGFGAGVIIDEEVTKDTFVYVKHTGVLASDNDTAANATNDFVTLANGDADTASNIITLYPGEFAFFPVTKSDGSDGGTEVGGLKVAANSAAVMIEFAYWTRTTT